MTREGYKQVQELITKIEETEQKWIKLVDEWVEHQSEPMPSLPEMVEDLLHHLRGLDKKKASEYEWMMIV